MNINCLRPLSFLLLVLCFEVSPSYAGVVIARGRLCQEEDPYLRNQDELMHNSSVHYDVIEVGRGHLQTKEYAYQFPGDQLHTNAVCVDIFWKTMTKPLPIDAILILSNDGWSRWSSYYIVAPVPWREILPYSPEAWEKVMKQTDAELLGDPISSELALAVAEKSAIEKGASPDSVFLLSPREDAHMWVVNVFYLQPPYLYEYAIRLNDRGDILDETMPLISDYYKSGEDVDAFMAREYANDNRGIPFRRSDYSAAPASTSESQPEDQPTP